MATTQGDRIALEAFADLIETTARDLRAASMPAQVARAIDDRLPAWERADPEFAAVLKEIKGQAWSMPWGHLQAVREKIAAHLDQNGRDVRRRLAGA